MDMADLSRQLENLIRIGTVAEVNHATRRVRVESGGLRTGWLKWRVGRAGATRHWDPPTVGEQVLILSPSGELANGIVLPGIYCDDHDSPSNSPSEHVMDFPDGARITYDHANGALSATGIQTALVQAAQSVTADTPMTHVTGNVVIDGDTHMKGTLLVDGLITYKAGMTGEGGDAGTEITGTITHNGGQLSSNGVVLHSHTHSGVVPGGANTGGPN